MKDASPVFSVIIATHNRPALLGRAVRAVREQSWPACQVIVVSDMHDPAASAVVSAWAQPGDLYLERCGKPGPSDSRNLGMALVHGDYFLFLDDDDSLLPDFLTQCAQQIASRSGASSQLFFTNFEVVHEQEQNGQTVTVQVNPVDCAGQPAGHAYVKNFVPNNCVLYPRELADTIRFDASIPYEDWDFMLSAMDRLPLTHLPVFGPRIHKNASTEHQQRGKSNESTLLQCYLAVYGKHPAPAPEVAAQRHALFAGLGLDLGAMMNGSAT